VDAVLADQHQVGIAKSDGIVEKQGGGAAGPVTWRGTPPAASEPLITMMTSETPSAD
jgi:hypothetical protein